MNVLLTMFAYCLFQLPNQTPVRPEQPSDIQLDTTLRYGKLQNGLTYYIQDNKTDAGKLNVTMVVNAGTNQEEHPQTAHLLEHMVSRGTIHFEQPKEFFQINGVRSVAYTDSEHTAYHLRNIPSARPELVSKALLFMSDITDNVILDSINIATERNTVLNELRRGLGVNTIMKAQYMNRVIGCPNYQYRDPLEAFKTLNSLNQNILRNFYRKWYTPGNQALIIVGDLNVASIEKLVISMFEMSAASKPPVKEKNYLPFHWTNQVLIATHPEKDDIEIDLINKRPYHPRVAKLDHSFFIKTAFLNKMMNLRFKELDRREGRSEGSTTIKYDNEFNEQGPKFGALRVNIRFIPNDQIEDTFKRKINALEQIGRFGFTENEWTIAQADYLLRDQAPEVLQSNNYIIDRYLRHFIFQEAYPGPEIEPLLIKNLLEEIKLADINELAKELMFEQNRDIVILAPEKARNILPDEITVNRWLVQIQSVELAPFEEISTAAGVAEVMTHEEISRLSNTAAPKKQVIKSLGITKLKLSNGVTVYVKPTEDKARLKNKLYIRGISARGASLYPPAQRFTAYYAPIVHLENGLGHLNHDDLVKFKKNKQIQMEYFIMENETQIYGEAPSSSAESLLQLIHQNFKDANCHPSRTNHSTNEPPLIVEPGSSAFHDHAHFLIDSLLDKMGIWRSKMTIPGGAQKVEVNTARRIYFERFENVRDFTFIITGDFVLEDILPPVSKYLGTLPAHNPSKTSRRTPVIFTEMNFRKTIHNRKSYEPAQVILYYPGTYRPSLKNDQLLDQLAMALQIRLRKRIREMEGGTYQVNATGFKYNSGAYYFTIIFSCLDAGKMTALALDEIQKLRDTPVETATLDQIKALHTTKLSKDLDNATYWLNYLTNQVVNRDSPAAIRRHITRINHLTARDIQRAATKYLNKENIIEIISLPQS